MIARSRSSGKILRWAHTERRAIRLTNKLAAFKINARTSRTKKNETQVPPSSNSAVGGLNVIDYKHDAGCDTRRNVPEAQSAEDVGTLFGA